MNSPLIHYIERARELGFPREKIEWSLFNVGWPLYTIKRAYYTARIIHGCKKIAHGAMDIGKGMGAGIQNIRTAPVDILHGLGWYFTFLHDGIVGTMRDIRTWYQSRGISRKPQRVTQKSSAPLLKRPAAISKTPIIPKLQGAPPMIARASAPREQKVTVPPTPKTSFDIPVRLAGLIRIIRESMKREGEYLRRAGYSFLHTLALEAASLEQRGVNVIEHIIVPIRNTAHERLTETEREIAGFLGLLISNTVRGIGELIYDSLRIIIAEPAHYAGTFAKKVLPARRHAKGDATSLDQRFEYHGVSLPGNIRGIDIIELSSRMFRTRRMRTFLTVLGISIGIGTILFLVSLGYGLQNIIFERIATTESLLTLDVTTGEKDIIALDRAALEKMGALPHVTDISPLASINGQVSIAELSANTEIRAVNTSYFELGGIRTSSGRIFEEEERDKAVVSLAVMRLFNITKPEDIIGKQAQFSLLFTDRERENTEVTRHATTYEIVGIVEDTETSFVYLPLSSLEQFTISSFSQVKVKIADEAHAEAIRGEIITMGFFVSAVSDILDQATKIFRAIQIVLAVFGLVALIVSAIGMFNTMTIALLERTQEIGIMKALGATPRDIWLMFLSESVIMGFLGGVGGILTGIMGAEIFNIGIGLLANAVGASSTNLFQRPLWFIITIAVFSTLIGFITGLWPAHRASKLNTLAALRYK